MMVFIAMFLVFLLVVGCYLSRNMGPLSPPFFFSVVGLLYFAIPLNIIVLIGYETDFYYVTERGLLSAVWIFIFYYLITYFVSFGLVSLFSPVNINEFNVGVERRYVLIICTIFLALSAIAKVYLISSGMYFLENKYSDLHDLNVPGIVKYLNNIQLFSLVITSVYLVLDYKVAGRINIRTFLFKLFAITFLYSVFFALLQGRRFGVIFPFIVLFLVYYYLIGVKFRSLLKLSVVALIFFMFITVFRLAQASVFAGDSGSGFSDVFSYIFSDRIFYIFGGVVDSVVSRIGNSLIVLAHVSDLRNEFNWSSTFNTFELILSSLVPSVFWPDKPDTSIGNAFGREIFLISPNNYFTKINPGWVGEFYYNGFYQMVFGGIFMSILSSLYYCFLVRGRGVLGSVLFVQYFIFIFSGFQMEVSFSINVLFKSTIVIAAVFFLSRFVVMRARMIKG